MSAQIKIENMLSVTDFVVGNDTLLLCKETPHKWLITNYKGGVLFASKTKKAAILEINALRKKATKVTAKPTAKKISIKTNKNLYGFRFGSKIDVETVVKYAGEVWGDIFELKNVTFDSHYWKADVLSQDGKKAKQVRCDYLINYLRVPSVLQTDAVMEHVAKRVVDHEQR